MKVKLFTHTDLDGAGCAILAKIAFTQDVDVDIDYCDYNNINDKVRNFIINKEYETFNCVFITDISVNEEVAELIHNTHLETFVNGFNLCEMFLLFDHHPTAEFLNKYWWVDVRVEIDGEKTSGTRMFYDYLMNEDYLLDTKAFEIDSCQTLFEFVEKVRKYDTWLWKEKYNDEEPKQWNDLYYIMGREKFINEIIYRINCHGYVCFSASDLALLEYKQKDIDQYIENKNKQIIKKDILGYKAGIVFAEQYHSECGNRLSEMNDDLDFIVLINPSYSVSYRTIKDIDLGKDVAKIFGGGGHPKASGSPISDDDRSKIIDILFTK